VIPLFAVPFLATLPAPPPPPDSLLRAIRYEFTVAAAPSKIWEALTTSAGLRTFFAPAAEIELRPFGKFSIQFDPSRPGSSAEDNVVLGFQPERMLSTTWNAPPWFPSVRPLRTFLQFHLTAEGTRVLLVHTGFGSGGEWDGTYEYFTGAWTWVAAALQYRFAEGPIDWASPPDLLPRMRAIGGEAAVQWARRKRAAAT
jgi:uncharacterized protein YndB with AHSA1/START domain